MEGILITTKRYDIEVVSCGTDNALNRLSELQPRAARLALQRKRKDWSRRNTLKELNRLSVPEMAAQVTIKLVIKTLCKHTVCIVLAF